MEKELEQICNKICSQCNFKKEEKCLSYFSFRIMLVKQKINNVRFKIKEEHIYEDCPFKFEILTINN